MVELDLDEGEFEDQPYECNLCRDLLIIGFNEALAHKLLHLHRKEQSSVKRLGVSND